MFIKSLKLVVAAISVAVVLGSPFVAIASKSLDNVDGYGVASTPADQVATLSR